MGIIDGTVETVETGVGQLGQFVDPNQSANPEVEELIQRSGNFPFNPPGQVLKSHAILTERPKSSGDAFDLPGPSVNETIPGANLPGPKPENTGDDLSGFRGTVTSGVSNAGSLAQDVADQAGGSGTNILKHLDLIIAGTIAAIILSSLADLVGG